MADFWMTRIVAARAVATTRPWTAGRPSPLHTCATSSPAAQPGSGGYGLDALLGYASRDHGDIDVSITDDDFPGFAAELPSWMKLHAAQSGQLAPIDEAVETEPMGNVWCLDTRSGLWCLQINRETGDSDGWSYRRLPSVRRAWPLAVREVEGMRVVAPEVQLLWKAADPAAKDETDKAAVTPLLNGEARERLRTSIRRAHPRSPWSDGFS